MADKLELLANLEGFDNSMQMLESAGLDSIVPCICKNEGCDYTAQLEGDQRSGYCEECGTQTVQSCLVLAGVM